MQENQPLVTVYITNYNYGRFIAQSIQSVLKQTLKDIELIIIDDGSTDNSRVLIDELEIEAKKVLGDNRVHKIYQKNLGLNKTNNVALNKAQGQFIMRLDADDYLDERALEILSQTLIRKPQIALAFPDYYIVDEFGEIQQLYRRFDFKQEVTLMDRPAHGACTMIRTEYLRQVGGYNEAFTCQDGYDLWLKIIHTYPVENVGLPLFSYRQHGHNLTGNQERLFSTRGKILDTHAQNKNLPPLKTFGVIPVRGPGIDPRSLPFRPLGDKELICWTIDAALKANLLDQVIITGPSQELLDFVKERYPEMVGKKIILHKRQETLAGVNTSIWETLRQLDQDPQIMGLNPLAYCLLYIEAPFRNEVYIDKAINTMRVFNVDTVDGVLQDSNFFYQHNGEGLGPLNKRPFFQFERDEIYRRCGGIHLIKRDFLRSGKEWMEGINGHITLDEKASLMLRSQFDYEMACALVDYKKGQ